ncbi:hypothetical protein DKX38_028420 [Salix brachista]|uniref:Uncharacterized protein n=1 Tax=Salix brachista TaxID=2182728 RepID=A0A5N5J992_9ROSI|nr:hypothetical protein DKX38_028420 [Salix brachista]
MSLMKRRMESGWEDFKIKETLTNPVDLLICMRAIKNKAFQASEYPVMVTKTCGDMLYYSIVEVVARIEIAVYQSYEEKERMISMFWKSLHDARFAEYQEGCEQLINHGIDVGLVTLLLERGLITCKVEKGLVRQKGKRPLISKEETAAVVVTAHSKNDEGMSSFAATKIATPPKKRDVLQPLQHRFIF